MVLFRRMCADPLRKAKIIGLGRPQGIPYTINRHSATSYILVCGELSAFFSTQKTQEGCGGLSGENPGAFPKAGADFPAAIFLAGKCPNLGRHSISCCWKIGEEFSSSVEICQEAFQQGISDSHILLEFSDQLTHAPKSRAFCELRLLRSLANQGLVHTRVWCRK